MKKLTYIFLIILMGITFMEAEAMSMFGKEEKGYRYYTLRNYFTSSAVLSTQIAIAIEIQKNPELESLPINGITPLPLMMDSRGEYYSKDAKLGPNVYFRTLQNMPINFINISQVLINSTKGSMEGCEDAIYNNKTHRYEKNGKICKMLDVHESIKKYPSIHKTIKDSLKNPWKYLKEENLDIWMNYSWKIIEMSGGEKIIKDPPYYSSADKKFSELKSKYIGLSKSSLVSGLETVGFKGGKRVEMPILYALRYINNERQITDIEYFEPDANKGKGQPGGANSSFGESFHHTVALYKQKMNGHILQPINWAKWKNGGVK